MSDITATHKSAQSSNKEPSTLTKWTKRRPPFRLRFVHLDGSPDLINPPIEEYPGEPFGTLIRRARHARHLRLADVAQQIFKADGQAISLPYMSDLEHHRCAPSPAFISQFAEVLHIPEEVLYFSLGRLPPDLFQRKLAPERIVQAFQVFRTALASSDES